MCQNSTGEGKLADDPDSYQGSEFTPVHHLAVSFTDSEAGNASTLRVDPLPTGCLGWFVIKPSRGMFLYSSFVSSNMVIISLILETSTWSTTV